MNTRKFLSRPRFVPAAVLGLLLAAAQPGVADLTSSSFIRSGGYNVVSFTAGSGTWTVPDGVTSLEVLVVGGGGGGGCGSNSVNGMGGGGGGFYYTGTTPYSVTPGSALTVVVGAGGAGGTTSARAGATGGTTRLDNLLAYGGQGGLYNNPVGAASGGYSTDGGTTILGVVNGPVNTIDGNGGPPTGGSGAGAPGGVGYGGAPGGNGKTSTIIDNVTAVYYAGGGGAFGALGGLGGGGQGHDGGGSAGTANKGGGGGSGGNNGPGGAGGSGIVIVAYPLPVQTWTVSFANNGGSAVASQTVIDGQTATQPANPTKTGYNFVQWCSDDPPTTPFVFNTPIHADTTLHAQWQVITYTLTYSAGANGSISGPTPQTVDYGTSGTAVTAVPDPGYMFLKWSDDSLSNPRTDANVKGDITVTASFQEILPMVPTLTARGDGKTVATFTSGSGLWTVPDGVTSVEVLVVGGGGGGACGSNSVNGMGGGGGGFYDTGTTSYSVTPGSALTVVVGAGGAGGTPSARVGSTGGTTKFDNLFAYGGQGGLYNNPTGAASGGYSADGGTTILGVVNGPVNTIDGNGGPPTGGSGAGAPGGFGYGGGPGGNGKTSIIIDNSTAVYYGGGGGAFGANGGLGGGGKSGTPGSPGTANTGGGGGSGGNSALGGAGGSGVVIVAYTAPVQTWTVSFNTGSGSTVPNQIIVDGLTAIQPANPTYSGYTFAGWYADNTFGIPFNFSTAIHADTTIYAKWLVNHTVAFQSNGGSAVASQTVADGNTATQPANPTWTGHTFTGWYADSELVNTFDFGTPITTDTTIYAAWSVNSYTLSYSPGANGSILGDTPQTVEYGGSGTAVTAVPDPGYVFVQWSDNSMFNPRTDTNVTGNITVTASFQAIVPIVPTLTARGDGKTVATFTSGSGTWTVPDGVTSLEVLVVGGGGGGGCGSNSVNGMGGGGGGFYYTGTTPYSVTPGSALTVVIGAGGAGGTPSARVGSTGGTTKFDNLLAYGGQGGLYNNPIGAASGGYSADGGTTILGVVNGPVNTIDGNGGPPTGGSGAGAPGGVGYGGGPGGNGKTSTIVDGVTGVYYGGGGGAFGANGGLGGGGKSGTPGSPGTANTGGGGGSGGNSALGGAGGSGVVIVAYTTSSGNNYTTWAAANHISGGPDAVGPDGLKNLLVYALNLKLDGTNGSPGTLSGKKVTFEKRTDAVTNGDVTYAIETSTDLQTWSPAAPDENTDSVISYTLPDNQDKIFSRLVVSQK